MLQEKENEAYQSIKAPVNLKNRTRLSVELQKKKARRQRTAGLTAVACMMLVVLSSGFMKNQDTILSIQNVAVSYDAVNLENTYGIVAAAEGRSSDLQMQIPMEIDVKKQAHITVSEGFLQQNETETPSEAVSEMDITGDSVIYWNIQGNTNNMPVCTIVTGEREYTYVIAFDEEISAFIIKQK